MSKLALEKSSFPLAAMLNFSILMSTAVSIWINAPPVLRAWETVKFLSSSLWPCPPFFVILSISGRRKIVARFSYCQDLNNRLKVLLNVSNNNTQYCDKHLFGQVNTGTGHHQLPLSHCNTLH